MNNNEKYNFGDDNKSGFHLPNDYFDLFNKQLLEQIQLQEELKECPTLASISKENPFYVSENYFDDLHLMLTDKIHAKKEAGNWIQKLGVYLFRPAFALSYSIIALLIVVLVYVYKHQNNTIQTCNDLACLSKEELLNSKEFNNLTTDDLMNEISETDFQSEVDTSLYQAIENELMENSSILTTVEDI